MTHVNTVLDDHPYERQHRARERRTRDLYRRAADARGAERRRLIDEVVVLHLGLAEAIARRYYRRGLDSDDVLQVANLGLVNAATRFDPARGKDFVSFAVPTISGEIKRHFRDHGWAVRPPRRVQELQAEVSVATAELAQEQGATPTPADVADRLGVEIDDVREAGASHECFSPASIDYRGADGEETSLADTLGEEDSGFERAEAVVALERACRDLDRRDRRILYLRFFRGRTQEEIGDELGVTQMQVSRLLARIMRQLRAKLGTLQPAPGR
ncbi:SigB/SigF/SigG family RNA polymerase sigma factor [Jiangella aurantiaca]|uniref:SigB/SigF/SigG family RNA polymerase sigma factor n=1 Tax=Jiangella aurantiaca TaxID=2530373 RepID=UPI00193CABD2|nr:SigB/SigF/SigG family RNA polymerase sigma factor [Jiangella aurantiaca]